MRKRSCIVVVDHLMGMVETTPLVGDNEPPVRLLKRQIGTCGTHVPFVQSATEFICDVNATMVASADES